MLDQLAASGGDVGSADVVFTAVIVVALVNETIWLWSLVDVLSWPPKTWEVAEIRKARWVVRVLLLGLIGTVLYLRGPRTDLKNAYSVVRTAR